MGRVITGVSLCVCVCVCVHALKEQVALLWQRDRAMRLSLEILQLTYPYRMALFA